MLSAQQIDRLEFQRDSDDAIVRALAYAQRKRADDRAKMLGVKLSEAKFLSLMERREKDQAKRAAFEAEQPKPGHLPRKGVYLINGEMISIATAAKRSGFTATTLYARMHAGATLQEAMTGVDRRNHRLGQGQTYTINGETMNLREWADRKGIPYNTLQKRLGRGMKPIDAIQQQNQRPRKGAGVVRSSAPSRKTGGVPVAQDCPEMELFIP